MNFIIILIAYYYHHQEDNNYYNLQLKTTAGVYVDTTEVIRITISVTIQ